MTRKNPMVIATVLAAVAKMEISSEPFLQQVQDFLVNHSQKFDTRSLCMALWGLAEFKVKLDPAFFHRMQRPHWKIKILRKNEKMDESIYQKIKE